MSANYHKIFIIGATSGIGEGLARRYHAQGRKVIIGGRRESRLNTLKTELPGLESVQLDIQDLPSLHGNISHVFNTYPDLDAVFVVAGIQFAYDFKNGKSTSYTNIQEEITTNLIAPIYLTQLIIPYLLALNKPTSVVLVSSGLAFIPLPTCPAYNATKSAIHQFCVTVRTQLTGTSLSIVELAPPYVDTGLDRQHKPKLSPNADPKALPMPLEKYLDSAMAGLAEVVDGKPKREVGVGFSQIGLDAWSAAMRPIMKGRGLEG